MVGVTQDANPLLFTNDEAGDFFIWDLRACLESRLMSIPGASIMQLTVKKWLSPVLLRESLTNKPIIYRRLNALSKQALKSGKIIHTMKHLGDDLYFTTALGE